MSNEPPDVTFAHLVDAFMHSPLLLRIDQRLETRDGHVTVLSHLELWSWRVVLRGVLADKFAVDSEPIDLEVEARLDEAADGISIGALGHERLVANRATMQWVMSWSMSDDVGTEYRRVSASSGGAARWSDFEVAFEPPVPKHAGRVSIMSPDGVTIDREVTFD